MSAEVQRFLFVVRRQEPPSRFRALQQAFRGDADVVDVIWDRRVAERRVAPRPPAGQPLTERVRDRRQAPPSSWSTFGFVMAPVASGDRPP
jgi:hypothetical protein